MPTLWAWWRARCVLAPRVSQLQPQLVPTTFEYWCGLATILNAYLFATSCDISTRRRSTSTSSSTTLNSNPSSHKHNPPTHSMFIVTVGRQRDPTTDGQSPGSSSGRSLSDHVLVRRRHRRAWQIHSLHGSRRPLGGHWVSIVPSTTSPNAALRASSSLGLRTRSSTSGNARTPTNWFDVVAWCNSVFVAGQSRTLLLHPPNGS